MKSRALSVIFLTLAVAGCTTTEEATQKASATWVGQSSDAFFSRHGAPYSQFAKQDGGILYKWRGGQTSIRRKINRPANATAPKPPESSVFSRSSQRSSTTISQTSPNTVVTKSRSSGSSVNIDVGGLLGAPTQPTHRTIQVFCEMQIDTAPDGTIRNLTTIRDTGGTFSLSRCDEVLNQ
ncbi:MAG: hypothetical protein AAF764_04175 [Pseudomonadota bacterium]